jgi:hypothetical protein
MTRRRPLLRGLALAGLGGLTGCVSEPGSRPDDGATAAPTATESTPDPTEAAGGDDTDGETGTADGRDTSDPVRGGAEPITADRTVADDELEYLEDEHAVKYVAAWRHTNRTEIEQGEPPEREPVYETTPFEDWATTECASVGADAVAQRIEERIDGDPAASVGITRENGEMAVSVQQTTVRDRDGEVVSEPSVPFERIVEVTPRAVEATVRLAEQEHTATVSVWVSETTMRYA